MSLITRRINNNDVGCHGWENDYDDDTDEDEDDDYATHATDDDGDVGCQSREQLKGEEGIMRMKMMMRMTITMRMKLMMMVVKAGSNCTKWPHLLGWDEELQCLR